jgi:hypothetical protein
MAKPKVAFKLNRIAEGEWQIIAEYPGVEDRYIKGFTSKSECHDWLNGSGRCWSPSPPLQTAHIAFARHGSSTAWFSSRRL